MGSREKPVRNPKSPPLLWESVARTERTDKSILSKAYAMCCDVCDGHSNSRFTICCHQRQGEFRLRSRNVKFISKSVMSSIHGVGLAH